MAVNSAPSITGAVSFVIDDIFITSNLAFFTWFVTVESIFITGVCIFLYENVKG